MDGISEQSGECLLEQKRICANGFGRGARTRCTLSSGRRVVTIQQNTANYSTSPETANSNTLTPQESRRRLLRKAQTTTLRKLL